MERDQLMSVKSIGGHISTHTLTWSVTETSREWNSDMTISTHTLTWSVTALKQLLILDGAISTHTLTWSVTGTISSSSGNNEGFQLTRSRGA